MPRCECTTHALPASRQPRKAGWLVRLATSARAQRSAGRAGSSSGSGGGSSGCGRNDPRSLGEAPQSGPGPGGHPHGVRSVGGGEELFFFFFFSFSFEIVASFRERGFVRRRRRRRPLCTSSSSSSSSSSSFLSPRRRCRREGLSHGKALPVDHYRRADARDRPEGSDGGGHGRGRRGGCGESSHFFPFFSFSFFVEVGRSLSRCETKKKKKLFFSHHSLRALNHQPPAAPRPHRPSP